MNKFCVCLTGLAGILFTSCEDQPEPVPPPPSGLVASVVSKTQIDLTWADNSSNETGFKIERKEGSGAFTVVGTTAKDVHMYSDQSLTEKTTYFYRVFAVSAAHETGEYSNEAGATTRGTPVLSTSKVSAITPFAATSGGNITDDGGFSITARGIVWSENANPTISLPTKTNDGTGTGSFTASLMGLNWDKEYHVRAYANYATGTAYGEDIVFTTTPIDISTAAFIEITHKAATSGGTIGGTGGSSILARGVVWGTSPNPTVSLNTKTQNGTGTGNFKSTINNLTPNTTYYARSYASNNATTSYGAEVNFTTANGIVDIDGNAYPIIQIGTQIWMTENLKTTKYNDGTGIPLVIDNAAWWDLTTPAYAWYNNDRPIYSGTYGALYNWYTVDAVVNGGKNVCPTDWHVPSGPEWITLTNLLGGANVAGGKLKEVGTAHWNEPNTAGTDEVGFIGLPAGNRSYLGFFYDVGFYALWWSATEKDVANAWRIDLKWSESRLLNQPGEKHWGLSVRCVKD